MPPMVMAHEEDLKVEILKKLGTLADIELFHNQILVATYVRPNITKGGILLAPQTVDEDKFQGKVGLVVKKGPQAFVSDEKTDFHGQNVEVGDWIFYKAADGWPQSVNGVPCRIFDNEFLIRGRISSPDMVY